MRRYSETRELCVKVRSLSEGSCRLRFEYMATDGASCVHDFADQRISSVNPVLLVDYDRDGAIGATDIARHMAGRYAYFWRNDDKWKGDNAFDLPFINRVNSSDDVVNGRNDLINFLPVSVDVAPFVAHWSSGSVYYRLEAHSSALRNAKLAFADIARTQIGDAPLGEDMDVDGNALYEAPVSALGGGTNLPPAFVALSQSGSGTIIMQFPDFARDHELYLNVYTKTDNALLFSAKLKTSHPVWLVGFIGLYAVLYVLTFTLLGVEPTPIAFVVELLPIVGMIASTVGFVLANSKAVRRLGLVSSPAWLTYNLYYRSAGAVICEVISLISIFVGMYRHDRKPR
jgi:hypothetical protein